MSRTFVNQISDGQPIDEVFLASEKQLRPNRSGNLYLQVRLSDKTGSLTAMMWNADQRQYESFANGDFLRVKGTAQFYNGAMQIIAKGLTRINNDIIDQTDFETVTTERVEQMVMRLAQRLRTIGHPALRNLADTFLVDESLMSKLRRAPAGVKNHHAYIGGLLEHIVSLLDLAAVVSPLYSEIDDDLLIMGAFLHDIGKIEELSYSPDLGYTDEGQLVGHLVQGVSILDQKIRESEKLSGEAFPEDIAIRLRHMIVSHHGDGQFGSPKPPMTYEALALHYLDNLDAKIANFRQLIAEDANASCHWTSFNAQLGRKIFKG